MYSLLVSFFFTQIGPHLAQASLEPRAAKDDPEILILLASAGIQACAAMLGLCHADARTLDILHDR